MDSTVRAQPMVDLSAIAGSFDQVALALTNSIHFCTLPGIRRRCSKMNFLISSGAKSVCKNNFPIRGFYLCGLIV